MRRFTCAVCGGLVAFEASACETCGAELGYLPDAQAIAPLRAEGSATRVDPSGARWWRCLNAAWGCNWMVPEATTVVWCGSCRLTRGRPDETNPDAVARWSTVEQAKRRLVAGLRSLGLPLDDQGTDGRVVFDLVHLPDSAGVTGHRPGIVTIDLREADDVHRESVRSAFGESDRTVLGHLRHEIGHHYFGFLVEQTGAIDAFRALFGDERRDYASAIEQHYARPVTAHGPTHISRYAEAHPSEDWAETFAHYLAMADGLETAAAFGVLDPTTPPVEFTDTVQRWRDLAAAINEADLGLGHRPAYPHRITPHVETKLAFVHDRVVDARSHGDTTPR